MDSINFKFDNEDKKQIEMLFPALVEKYKDSLKKGERVCAICDAKFLRPRVWNFFRALFGDGGSETGILTGNSHFEGANKIALYNVKRNWFYTQTSISAEQIDELCEAIEKNQNNGNSEERQYILDRGHWAEDFIKAQFTKYFDEFYKEYLEEQFGKEIESVELIEDNYMYVLIKHPMFADFDGKITIDFKDGTSLTGILELKTVKGFLADEKFGKAKCGEFAPPNYVDQTQHYMYVDGKAEFAIIVFDGESFGKSGIRFIRKDDEYIKNIVKLHDDFWFNHVMTGVVPTESDKDFLSDILDKEFQTGESELGRLISKKVSEIVKLQNKKSELSKETREIEKQINILESEVVQKMRTDTAVAEVDDFSYRISVVDKASSRFNKAKLLKAHPELKETIEEFTDVKNSKTVTITSLSSGGGF